MKEEIAYVELKKDITEVMYKFTEKYATPTSNLYPQCKDILVDVLTKCLSEAQIQSGNALPFTKMQVGHICSNIGNWYMYWKHNLINWEEKTHQLEYAKECLKIIICDDDEGV